MGVQYANPQIVTNGLVLNLNAGDRNSYPGTGTTWRDISGNGNNGTILGSTFNSGNGGAIVFDGLDDYIATQLNTSLFSTQATISMFLKLNVAAPEVGRTGIITFGNTTGNGTFPASHYPWTNGLAYFNVFRLNRVDNINLSPTINRTSPHMLSITTTPGTNGYNIYQNLSLIHQTTGENSINLSSTEIARSVWDSNNYYLDGNIYSVLVYNRTLSTTEILQNYNAQKSRFGL